MRRNLVISSVLVAGVLVGIFLVAAPVDDRGAIAGEVPRPESTTPVPSLGRDAVSSPTTTIAPLTTAIVPPDPDFVYNPERAGEEMPPGYRQVLYRDQINPIYNPRFTTPDNVNWPRDMLVIGVSGEAEAKAYPIAPLNSREMVIDSLEGIPILVTW